VGERKVHLADDVSVFDDIKQDDAEENEARKRTVVENRHEESSKLYKNDVDLWKTEPLAYVDVSFRTAKDGKAYVSRVLTLEG